MIGKSHHLLILGLHLERPLKSLRSSRCLPCTSLLVGSWKSFGKFKVTHPKFLLALKASPRFKLQFQAFIDYLVNLFCVSLFTF